MQASRVWKCVRSWTVGPMLWLAALLGYVFFASLLQLIDWWQSRKRG